MNDFEQKLAQIRPDLLQFARLKLRDDVLAEDVVQETLTTVLAKQNQFLHKSSLKTWVYSILKNQISDYFRQHQPTISFHDDTDDAPTLSEIHDALFDSSGHWLAESRPQSWQNLPEQQQHQLDFLRILEQCLTDLPPNTAQVFYLREILDWTVADICQEMNINADYCYTILYRARHLLRICLQIKWFDPKET